MGQGLQALHAKGIIHRDLKPQNVLLTEGLTARISDMGLSRRLTGDQSFVESATIGARLTAPPTPWTESQASMRSACRVL